MESWRLGSSTWTSDTAKWMRCVLSDPTHLADAPADSAALAPDVQILKQQLRGVTMEEVKLIPGVDGLITNGKKVIGSTGQISEDDYNSFDIVEYPVSVYNKIRFLGVLVRSNISDSSITDVGYAFGHYDNNTWVTDKSYQFLRSGTDSNIIEEYLVSVPEYSTYFRTECRYGEEVMPAKLFYCYGVRGESVIDTIKSLDINVNKSVNKSIGKTLIPLTTWNVHQLGPSAYNNILITDWSPGLWLLCVHLRLGDEIILSLNSLTPKSIRVCTTIDRPVNGTIYDNYERFENQTNFIKRYKFEQECFFTVFCDTESQSLIKISKIINIDTTNYTIEQLQPLNKDLRVIRDLSTNALSFEDNASYCTKMSFLKSGEKIHIKVKNKSSNIPSFFNFGVSSKYNPPIANAPISKTETGDNRCIERFWTKEDDFYWDATDDCWVWIAFTKNEIDSVTFERMINVNKMPTDLPAPIVGSMKMRVRSYEGGTDTNITASVHDIYDIYDTLVSNYPNWISKKSNIGTSTVGNYEIRHYEVGYQHRYMMYGYKTLNSTNNKMFDDGSINRDMRHIILDAGIHGDEQASVYGVANAIKEIIESTDEWAMFIKNNFIIDVIPIVSPYGYANNRRTVPYNGNNIDPNRDYGDLYLNETKSMVDFVLSTNACAFIDCHNSRNADTNERLFVAAPKGCRYFQPALNMSVRLSSFFSQSMPSAYNYPNDPKVWFLVNENEDERSATLGGFMSQLGIIAFTLEAPRNLNFNNPGNNNTAGASTLMTMIVENVIPSVGVMCLG